MSDRRIEYVALDDLRPADRNAKDHDEQLIGDSIGRFGFIEIIHLDERTGRIISGHGRRERLLALAADGEAPPDGVKVDDAGRWLAPVVVGWASKDDADAEAAAIALNRGVELGGWHRDVLAEMLSDLSRSDLGLLGVGYGPDDLDDLLAGIQEAPIISFDPEDHFGEAAHAESTFPEWAENYRNKQVRSMVFDYPLDDYTYVAAACARARSAFGVESNAELFLAMLRKLDESHPEASETAATA